MEDILQICNLIYLHPNKLKYISYVEYYTRYYNLTIKKKNYIKEWFEALFIILEEQQLVLKNIKSVADILLYPIKQYNINFIYKCININYRIITRKVSIFYVLSHFIPLDLVEYIYKMSINSPNSYKTTLNSYRISLNSYKHY